MQIDLSDVGMHALVDESKSAALAGWSGKQVIHPKQVCLPSSPWLFNSVKSCVLSLCLGLHASIRAVLALFSSRFCGQLCGGTVGAFQAALSRNLPELDTSALQEHNAA